MRVSDRITVKIDPDLEDLIPGFLNNRRGDVARLRDLLASGDFAAIRMIGHSMKGAGGGYGFDPITQFGGEIETAAVNQDADTIRVSVARLEDYLQRVQPVFE